MNMRPRIFLCERRASESPTPADDGQVKHGDERGLMIVAARDWSLVGVSRRVVSVRQEISSVLAGLNGHERDWLLREIEHIIEPIGPLIGVFMVRADKR